MNEPEPGQKDKDVRTSPNPVQPPDTNIPDEEALSDAVGAGEVREEAEKLGSVPYERHKKENGD